MIPAVATSIGASAFASTTSLTSVTLESNPQLSTIGLNAFLSAGDTSSGFTISLVDLTALATILPTAFQSSSISGAITIPASVVTLGASAFQLCTKLTSVTFAPSGLLSSIPNLAFDQCSNITTITLPATVTSIGTSSFSSIPALTTVAAATGLTAIGDNAFQSSGTTSGFTFTLPVGLLTIGQQAFASSGILAAAIPSAVTGIATQAYQSATRLATLTFLGTSLTALTDFVFAGTSALTTVTLPSSITTIGASAFAGSDLTTGLDLRTTSATLCDEHWRFGFCWRYFVEVSSLDKCNTRRCKNC
eukprot:gene33085-40830_t